MNLPLRRHPTVAFARPRRVDQTIDQYMQGHEEYLVRKLAEHLRLSTADLVETKLRAREEFLEEEP